MCVVEDSGRLRAADDCRDNETAHVLATEAALQAAEACIADLEEQVAALGDATTPWQTTSPRSRACWQA